MSQTSRDRVNSRHVRTHEKNSGDAVRRLGTIMQSIFCAQSGASIRLTVWEWSGESVPRGFFRPTDRPWVSEDALGSAFPASESIFSTAGVPGCYTSHTFRSGAATSAASCGLPDHLIKTLGRLSSDAYQIYINTPVSTIVGVASLLT